MTIDSFGAWSERYWSGRPLPALINHIIDEYHQPLHRDLDAIERLLNILLSRDAVHVDLLSQLGGICSRLQAEVAAHTADEEIVCFPHIIGLAEGEIATALNMRTMLPKLTRDHAALVDALQEIRERTDEFQPPAGACVLLSSLFALLEDVERQLSQQVHLEQHILFPRAAALEREVMGRALTTRSVIPRPITGLAAVRFAPGTLD